MNQSTLTTKVYNVKKERQNGTAPRTESKQVYKKRKALRDEGRTGSIQYIKKNWPS